MLKKNRILVALACVGLAVSVGGCAAGVPPAPEESPSALSFDAGVDANYGIDMVACLSPSGWDVSVGEDRSVEARNLGDQASVYQAEYDACEVKFGYDDPAPVLSTAQLEEVYPHVLWSTKCLQDAGYSPDSPPSEQSFIDGYTERGALWTPHEKFATSLSSVELKPLFEKCPSPLQR